MVDHSRFDTITRRIASRRTELRAGGLGLAGALLGGRTVAQDATPAPLPADPHPSVEDAYKGAQHEFQ